MRNTEIFQQNMKLENGWLATRKPRPSHKLRVLTVREPVKQSVKTVHKLSKQRLCKD